MFWLSNAIDETAKAIQEDIAKHEGKIEQWLKNHWYNVIFRDTRTFFYSYTVIKGNKLETKREFTFNEMKTIITLPDNDQENEI